MHEVLRGHVHEILPDKMRAVVRKGPIRLLLTQMEDQLQPHQQKM